MEEVLKKTEKVPILGIIQRCGQVVLEVVDDVRQQTIAPIIKEVIKKGCITYTDEYSIYHRMTEWGYDHKTVNHGKGEYARDDDGDGFYEIHVNTMEGTWSLLRSWLRPHRGVAQEKLPIYVAFFEFVHNARKRGKSLLQELLIEVVGQKRPSTV